MQIPVRNEKARMRLLERALLVDNGVFGMAIFGVDYNVAEFSLFNPTVLRYRFRPFKKPIARLGAEDEYETTKKGFPT